MSDRKIYKHRKLHGLKSSPDPTWVQLGGSLGSTPLSYYCELLEDGGRVHLCGKLEQVTREFMEEPLSKGWKFGREFVFKHRTAVYERGESNLTDQHRAKEVHVKLVSHRESWLPGCEDMTVAIPAWRALESEWQSTGLPLLSSPAATGKALLWESLPDGVEFPALDDDLAKLIRSVSPQHRIEVLHADNWKLAQADFVRLYQYDGRWMYAAMCGLDRFPVGEPKRTGSFIPYQPGWHKVAVKIPDDWSHIGLLPVLDDRIGWTYPRSAGAIIVTWAAEPELTMALKHGWEIVEHYDGYAFEKGRPLGPWSKKLIEMRERLQMFVKASSETIPSPIACDFAAAAIRQILNHTIGAIHRNDYEREEFVSDDNFRQWRREHPDLAESESRAPEKVEGGYLVPCFVPDTSRLSIFTPYWSATIYSLARARVAEWCLKCDPATLVKINGDAIYSTVEQPALDALNTGRLGQPRRK